MQPLTEWPGDVGSLLTELKRRAGVSTDTELARVIGTSQSNVSTWRKRGAIPKSALLKFERLNLDGQSSPAYRMIAARMIAIRVAEFACERTNAKSRAIFYMIFAAAWDNIIDAVVADLAKKEKATKRWPSDLAGQLIEDDRYMSGLADWVLSLGAAEVLGPMVEANPNPD